MNKCEFYNQTFLENLYNFEFDLDKKNVVYSDGAGSVSLDISKLEDILSSITPTYTDVWTPYFVNKNNSKITNSNLARSTIIKSENLGVEEIIKFKPAFRDWSVTNANMASDWIITPIIAPFIPQYGVLFWYKSRNPKTSYTIDEIPANSVIYPTKTFSYQKIVENKTINISINRNTKLIKKNNKILLIANEDKVILKNTEVGPNPDVKYFDVDEYITFKNKDNPKILASLKDFSFTFTKESKPAILDKFLVHISDGEAYSYVDSEDSKSRDYANFTASKTYLSPVLYENYRQIYHHLTLDYKKIIDIVKDSNGFQKRVPQPMFPFKQFRLFKKLCYFLSTYPLFDRTTISILQSQEVKDIVNKFITTRISNVDDEEKILYNTLLRISGFFKDVHIPENYYDKNNIPKTLLTKYGAKLRSEDDNTITLSFNKQLEHGENIKCNWDINALCDKNKKASDINYNLEIKTGKFSVISNIKENQSSITLKTVGNDIVTTIPLWDIKKRQLINNDALFSVGEDIEINFNTATSIPDILNITKNNDEISFNLNLDLFLEDTILDGSVVSAEWSKIEGSDCLRFGNSNLTTIRDNGIFTSSFGNARFYTSEDISPNIYIKRPGKYTIQCRLSSNFGVFVDTINIYVVNKDNDDFDIYTRPVTEPLRRARILNLSQNNQNIITLPNIREFIIGKTVFWPTYSDLSILVPKRLGRANVDFIEPLGSPRNKFAFPLPVSAENNEEAESEIFFSLSIEPKNCIVDISKIILSNIYGPDTPYCEPVYRCTMDNELFDLDQAARTVKDPITNQIIDIPFPDRISTNRLEIKTENPEQTNQLAAVLFDKKENLQFNKYDYNREIYSSIPGPDVIIDGRGNAPNDNIVAYENFPDPTDSDYQKFVDSFVVPLQKTYFHPNSGLLETDYVASNEEINNKTSIIIGDHSKRNCKTFRGLGFQELKNESSGIQIYSSNIHLFMRKATHDIVDGDLRASIAHDEAFVTPEQYSNYGYRNVSLNFKSAYSHTDEISSIVYGDPDGPVQSNSYCNDQYGSSFGPSYTALGEPSPLDGPDDGPYDKPTIIYYYPYPGPRYSPKFIEPLIYDRNFGRTIGDLEIKLNFLNYINPKELIVWLDISPPSRVRCTVNRDDKGVNDPYFFNNLVSRDNSAKLINNIPNADIKKYLSSLFLMNNNLFISKQDNDSTSGIVPNSGVSEFDTTYSTLLLNQDHIEFSTYNNILKFTDNTNNLLNNINVAELTSPQINNTVGRNINGELEFAPTQSAPNFSDYESYKYKTIINTNNLSKYLGANFFKLQNMPLFEPCVLPDDQQPPPKNSSATRFTLNIAVVQESDNGSVYDRIINTDNLLNINNIKTKNISNITNHSLCSWDLIISNSKEQLNFEDKDVLGQIDYNHNFPKYDGYNFYGKIPSNLIPPINLNAPNNAFFNLNSCFYSRESLTASRPPQPPVLNITPLIYIPSFTLIGEIANANNLIEQGNIQSKQIAGFFNDLRRQRQQEEFNREIYIPKFENYVTGRSEKALVSVSKDKKNWFKLEAGILRYKNCPIFKNKKYRYKKIHYFNNFKNLAKFNISIVNNIEDLIGINSIKTISINSYISFANMQKKSFFNQVKADILTLEKQITALKNNNKEIPQILQDRLLAYQNFYYTVGPNGFEDDDIVKIEIINDNNEVVQVKLYTIQIKNKNTNDIIFIDIGTKNFKQLLIHNKSIFIDNNILEIFNNITDEDVEEEQEEQEEEQDAPPEESEDQNTDTSQKKQSKKIIIIDESRPYFIYAKDSLLTFFTKKENITESEKANIDKLQILVDKLNLELQELLAEFDEKKNTQPPISEAELTTISKEIDKTKQEIIVKESEIFNLEHIKSENKLLSKGLIFKEQRLQTLFYLEDDVNSDDSFLIISPSDNRIIIFDKDYYTKESDAETLNQWTFSNNSGFNRNEVVKSSESTINLGSYGSGSQFNKQEYLYNPEIQNKIKDFISNIVINIKNGFDHKEPCSFFDEQETDEQETDEQETEEQETINRAYNLNNIFISNDIKLFEPYIHQIAKLNNNRDLYQILDTIMNTQKYNAYLKNMSIKYILEGNIDYEVKEEGDIQLNKNFTVDYTYKLVDKDKNSMSVEILQNRLEAILINIKTEQFRIDINNAKISNTTNTNEIKNITQNTNLRINKINTLKLEYNHLSYYIDKCEYKNEENSNIIPNIFAIVNINDDKSISIMEESTDDYYIINIDAEQMCPEDDDKNPKIMRMVKYELVGQSNRFLYGADPFMFIGRFGGLEGEFTNDILSYTSDPVSSTYTFTQTYIDNLKSFYDLESSGIWIGRTSERTFYLNGGSEWRGAVIKATYSYLQYVPNTSASLQGGLNDNPGLAAVKKVLNLNDTDTLYIDFKRIPRNLRNVDNIFDRYVPNFDGFLTKSLIPSPGGLVDASLKTWKCVRLESGADVPLPDNFKWMNLMKYIAFYKNYLIEEYNLDINQNMQIVRCRDEMELIPYEYKEY